MKPTTPRTSGSPAPLSPATHLHAPVFALLLFLVALLSIPLSAGAFAINDRVAVSATAVNVRATPHTSGTLLGTQPQNALGTIVDGPATGAGYTWWNVNFDTGVDGWVAEPYIAWVSTPTATPYEFAVGEHCKVYNSTGANVRSAPNQSLTPIGTQPNLATGVVIGGPTIASGYTWWNIDYTSGPDGWSVDNFLVALPYGDTKLPSTPASLAAGTISATQVTLSWSASSDNVAVTGYQVFRNGYLAGTPTGTSWTDTGLKPATAYSYTVNARDAAGNVSLSSNTVNASTSAGTLPATPAPTVSFSASPGAVVKGSFARLTWSTTNATSCTASGGWSGTKPTKGSQWVPISATASSTTYTITCSGTGGTKAVSTTVNTVPLPWTSVTAVEWTETNKYTTVDPTGFTLVLSEEFSGALALSGPRLFAPVHSNFGASAFDGPTGPAYSIATVPDNNNGGNLSVLRLTGYKNSSGQWRSGNVQTANASQSSGSTAIGSGTGFACLGCYFETRVKFAPLQYGLWAGIWTLSPQAPEGHVETDTLEWYGGDPKGHHQSLNLWAAVTNGHTYQSNYTGLSGTLDDGNWHTHGLQVKDGYIIVFMDRKEVSRIPAPTEYLRPQYMLTTLAMYPDGMSQAVSPMIMDVDYMRAYATPDSVVLK